MSRNPRYTGGIRLLILSALLAACFSRPSAAQTGAASIQGTVRDITGAVIPRAQIRLVHIATSVPRETSANEAGFFIFPAAVIGDTLAGLMPATIRVHWDGKARRVDDPKARRPAEAS